MEETNDKNLADFLLENFRRGIAGDQPIVSGDKGLVMPKEAMAALVVLVTSSGEIVDEIKQALSNELQRQITRSTLAEKETEIFSRDQWRCKRCADDTSTLHVHHKFYATGLEPWDYPMDSLVTLCKSCHQSESKKPKTKKKPKRKKTNKPKPAERKKEKIYEQPPPDHEETPAEQYERELKEEQAFYEQLEADRIERNYHFCILAGVKANMKDVIH